MSVEGAMFRYNARQLKKNNRAPKRKNRKPEREVEKTVMAWLEKKGFSCDVIESKATYSEKIGRYTTGNACPGFSDVVGCDSDGRSVFIELKAIGKRSTLSEAQRIFLSEKIEHNAFAVVCDSVYSLADCYDKWRSLRLADQRKFLFNMLPKSRIKNDGKGLFD